MKSGLEYALVVFSDLRGFTVWSSMAAVGFHLQRFMRDFYKIFLKAPGLGANAFLKPNGDGVLIVKTTGIHNELLDQDLDDFLGQSLPFIESSFVELVQRYQRIMRCAIPLRLAFGISAGLVHRIEFTFGDGRPLVDFASGTLNTASRLCDIARPAGVVIAAEAFPDWIPGQRGEFELVELSVRNVSASFPVWLSREAIGGAVPREIRRVALEFHVGTVCLAEKLGGVLLARRREDRALFPGLWETGGGQLYREEGIEDAARRIGRTEFGVGVDVTLSVPMVPFKIETSRSIIPGVKVLCLFDEEDFSGYRDERQHTETRYVELSEFRSPVWTGDKLIEGTRDVVEKLVTAFIVGK